MKGIILTGRYRFPTLPGHLVGRTMDTRSVYAATRVLLVPSQWKAETWGRVASEAQFSGIPVLASDVGGSPEAVAPGGVT